MSDRLWSHAGHQSRLFIIEKASPHVPLGSIDQVRTMIWVLYRIACPIMLNKPEVDMSFKSFLFQPKVLMVKAILNLNYYPPL